jgi:hypothetical protein
MKTLRTLIITIPAVRNISRNGEVIILDDHSVYLIDTMDHLKTRNWERHDSIRVIPKGSKCVLLNYNTGDEVSADSARPCSPAIGRDVTPRANSFTSSVSAPSGLSYTISSTGKRRSAQRGSRRSVGEFHNAFHQLPGINQRALAPHEVDHLEFTTEGHTEQDAHERQG